MSNMVDHPQHYGGDTVYEVLKVLEAWFTPEMFIGLCRGQAIIYQARADKKTENWREDLEKAAFYTNYEINYRRRLNVGLTGNNRAVLVEHIESMNIETLLAEKEKNKIRTEIKTEVKAEG